MPPITAEQALYNDLLSLYARAGAEVSYETDKGEIKPYWPKRFLQAVKRAERKGELFEFVHRLLAAEDVSLGFLILKKAGRLDLTVEALAADATKPYYGELDFDAIQIARRRLADHGYDMAPPAEAEASPPSEGGSGRPQSRGLEPGDSIDLRVTVERDGRLSLALI